MKKFLAVLAAVLFVSGAAFADFVDNNSYDYAPNQGFQDNSTKTVVSVKDALGYMDNQPAVIKGNIVKRLSKDKYLFKDKTGEIVAEIDYKYWGGLQVTSDDVIELSGEIDRDYNSVVLDVYKVRKAK